MAFILFATVFGDRLLVSLQTGGRGTLGLLTFAAPLAAGLAIARFGLGRSLRFLTTPAFIIGVWPFLMLTLVLPVLGVMFNRYPDRTLLAAASATTAFSFLVLGAVAAEAPLRVWGRWLLLAIVVQFAYAVGQLVYVAELPGRELFSPLHAWDLSLQAAYGAFVQARSSGLYFNPNELGLWAAVAAALAWQVLTGRSRVLGALMALLTLLLSQSRGASVALLAGASTGLILAVARGRTSVPRALQTVLALGAAVAVAVVLVIAIEPSEGLITRFSALIAVATQGPGADPNLAGRLSYWSSVVDLNALYPWGTWGPPELLLGTAVDSTWFRLFAQGSVLAVGAFLLLLATPFTLRSTRFEDSLIVITVITALAGLTQTPLDYPIAYLYWALLGTVLQASVGRIADAEPLSSASRSGHGARSVNQRSGLEAGPPGPAGAETRLDARGDGRGGRRDPARDAARRRLARTAPGRTQLARIIDPDDVDLPRT